MIGSTTDDKGMVIVKAEKRLDETAKAPVVIQSDLIDKEFLEATQRVAEKPKRKRAARRMPELWAVVEMPDGSRQAYTCVSKALQVAGESLVREVQLCRISPKSRGFKVVEVVKV